MAQRSELVFFELFIDKVRQNIFKLCIGKLNYFFYVLS
jgi:hypothetical protein